MGQTSPFHRFFIWNQRYITVCAVLANHVNLKSLLAVPLVQEMGCVRPDKMALSVSLDITDLNVITSK